MRVSLISRGASFSIAVAYTSLRLRLRVAIGEFTTFMTIHEGR